MLASMATTTSNVVLKARLSDVCFRQLKKRRLHGEHCRPFTASAVLAQSHEQH
jgi:hypothetical protein